MKKIIRMLISCMLIFSLSAGFGNLVMASEEETDTSTELFTERDLEQTVDLDDAIPVILTDGENVIINRSGKYLISGSATDVSIKINVDKESKVQLILDGITIENANAPAINVISADKVFITTIENTNNTLTVTGDIEPEGDTNLDAVIFSKEDLVFNGQGTLIISSTDNGIVGKDDVKITGGTYIINAADDGIEVKESLLICDGSLDIVAGKDGFHCVDDDDLSTGSIYISGGSFNIDSMRQGFQAATSIVLDGGDIYIDATEGMEATFIQINECILYIHAYDDGINATSASPYYDVLVEINGGSTSIDMESGDTDGIDANGSIVVNGGYVSVNGQSAFDYDVSGVLNGGTVIVNGEQVDTLPQSQMGGGGHGGGGHGGRGGF